MTGADAPVPYQLLGELNAMIAQLDTDPPASILEIGVWAGGTLAALGEAFPDAVLVGVDQDVQPSALEVGATVIIEGRSQEETTRDEIRAIRDQYDFVFIDGAHDLESCEADFEFAVSLNPRWIGLHDITSRNTEALEVWELWDRIVKYAPRMGREVFEFKQQDDWWGIGLILLPKAAA